jgi:hypothetical protein
MSYSAADDLSGNQILQNGSSISNLTYSNDHPNSVFNNDSSTVEGNFINESGCCSILLHVNDSYDVFGYRRDSTYPADLHLQYLDWYGKEAIKEYKDTVNGYFFHTIITADGWIISMGGDDVVELVKELENLAGSAVLSGSITNDTLFSVNDILTRLKIGHFLIKDPKANVGVVIYNQHSAEMVLVSELFKMTDGQYVSVPNYGPYYRKNHTSTDDPVYSVINLALTDKWGINRRNILTYQIFKDVNSGSTRVYVYASRTRFSDNIIFQNQLINGSILPITSINCIARAFIGHLMLKYHLTINDQGDPDNHKHPKVPVYKTVDLSSTNGHIISPNIFSSQNQGIMPTKYPKISHNNDKIYFGGLLYVFVMVIVGMVTFVGFYWKKN